MTIQVETQLERAVKDIVSFVLIVSLILILVAAPMAVLFAFYFARNIEDPMERKYRKYYAWWITAMAVVVWEILGYPIVSMTDWWIFVHWPTFWGMFFDMPRNEAVFVDGLTCIPLIYLFEHQVKHYGYEDHQNNYHYPSWYINQENREYQAAIDKNAKAEANARNEAYFLQHGRYPKDEPSVIICIGTVAIEADSTGYE